MIDMNAYEQQKGKAKKAKRGMVLIWTGVIITLVAVILLIVGFASNPIYAVIGGIILVLGIAVVFIGLQLKKQGKGIDLGITTVKCRNCGYLERAGAEYCSKCGSAM